MMYILKEKIDIILIVVLLIFSIGSILLLNTYRNKIKEKDNIIFNMSEEVSLYRNRDSSFTARIYVLETQSAKDFITMNTKDETIQKLQELVKQNKSKLKPGSSATVFTGENSINTSSPTTITSRDTVYKDKLVYIYPEYSSSINAGSWIVGKSFANKDSTRLDITVRNEYTVVIGEEKQGFLKKSKPYVEVTSLNPYSEIQTLRTYKVSNTKQKNSGIGVHVGYGVGFTPIPKLVPVISIGYSYTIFNF